MPPDVATSTPKRPAAEVRGHDVFVSYAREDQEFVRRLTDALAARGKRAWVDWADIPPTAEWMTEIRAAIDASDTYVAVISPDSIGSKVCAAELDSALEGSKRVVPVLCREVRSDLIPEDLGKRQWVSFTDGFDAGLSKLVEALDTDLDHVKAHTRLLVKAREWETKGDDKGLLLRGRELGEAESWLEGAGSKEPAPTLLQNRYLLASRKAAARRQRGAISLVTAAFVLAASLGVFAWTQRSAAIDQRNRAEQQTAVANSRALSAQALTNMDGQLDLGMLLAIEADRAATTPESTHALQVAAQRSMPIVREIHGTGGPVGSVAWSPDGKTVAAGYGDGSVHLWDPTNGQPLGTLAAGDRHIYRPTFSPDGHLIATGSPHGSIELWDPATGAQIGAALTGPLAQINGLAFSPDGQLLAAGGEKGTLVLWDPSTGHAVGAPLVADRVGYVTWVTFSPDGRTLAAGTASGTVILWDPATGQRVRELPSSANRAAVSVAFSPDGRELAATMSAKINVWDPATGKPTGKPLHGIGNSVWGGTFSPDGRVVAAGSGTGDLLLWDAATGKSLGQPLAGHSAEVTSVAFSPDGHFLATGGVDGSVIVWEPLAGRTWGGLGTVSTVAYSPDGRLIASGSKDAKIVLTNASTGVRVGRPMQAQGPWVNTVSFSRDGRLLASASDDGTVVLWNVRTQSKVAILHQDRGPAGAAVFSPDGRMLAAGYDDGSIVFWDPRTGKTMGSPLSSGHAAVDRLAFSPDGQQLAATDFYGRLIIWDVGKRQPIGKPLVGHAGFAYGVAYSPNGHLIATAGGGDNLVVLWDADAHKKIADLIGHKNTVVGVAFSPDGETLASASLDKTAILWDVKTLEQIGEPLAVFTGWVGGVDFGPSGKSLAVGSLDGSIVQFPALAWSRDTAAMTARLCEVVGRNLTRDEWGKYLPSEPYRPTCPGFPSGAQG